MIHGREKNLFALTVVSSAMPSALTPRISARPGGDVHDVYRLVRLDLADRFGREIRRVRLDQQSVVRDGLRHAAEQAPQAPETPAPRTNRRRHRSLGRRTSASTYGLEASARGRKVLAAPGRLGIIETGDGRSIAERAAVAAVAFRAPSATAAGMLPMTTVPPYSRLETVKCMGTS